MKHSVMDPCFYCGAGDHADGDCPLMYPERDREELTAKKRIPPYHAPTAPDEECPRCKMIFALGFEDGKKSRGRNFTSGMTWADELANEKYDEGVNAGRGE